MLQQPVRVGGLALGYALATSALVLITFLVSNLLLSVLGGIGQVTAAPAAKQTEERPAAAVLLSADHQSGSEKRCERLGRDVQRQRTSGPDRCDEQRRNGQRLRP